MIKKEAYSIQSILCHNLTFWGDTCTKTLRLYSLCLTVLLEVAWETLLQLYSTHFTFFQKLTYEKKNEEARRTILNVKFKI